MPVAVPGAVDQQAQSQAVYPGYPYQVRGSAAQRHLYSEQGSIRVQTVNRGWSTQGGAVASRYPVRLVQRINKLAPFSGLVLIVQPCTCLLL